MTTKCCEHHEQPHAMTQMPITNAALIVQCVAALCQHLHKLHVDAAFQLLLLILHQVITTCVQASLALCVLHPRVCPCSQEHVYDLPQHLRLQLVGTCDVM